MYSTLTNYREEKSLRHIAMVAKFLNDNKPIKSLKGLFALSQTFFFSGCRPRFSLNAPLIALPLLKLSEEKERLLAV